MSHQTKEPTRHMSLRVPVEVADRLNQIAKASGQSKAAIMVQALEQLLSDADQQSHLTTSVDRMAGEIASLEQRLTERLTHGLAEVHDELRFLKLLSADLAFQFLAHTPPAPNPDQAAANGQKRFTRLINRLEDIHAGKTKGPIDLAKDQDHAAINSERGLNPVTPGSQR
ncbi:MAG: ribbon-helix-helix protein, CopG family [Geminicoccaceae bacterium]